jgi:hypothetical protein
MASSLHYLKIFCFKVYNPKSYNISISIKIEFGYLHLKKKRYLHLKKNKDFNLKDYRYNE